jgi:hypothetical protein
MSHSRPAGIALSALLLAIVVGSGGCVSPPPQIAEPSGSLQPAVDASAAVQGLNQRTDSVDQQTTQP